MSTAETSTVNRELLKRPDTLFGVCEGVGQDIGINPTWVRLVFTGLLFWQPMLALAAYGATGAVIYGLRWLVPVTSRSAEAAPVTDARATVDNAAVPANEDAPALLIAA